MSDGQLDLFAGAGIAPAGRCRRSQNRLAPRRPASTMRRCWKRSPRQVSRTARRSRSKPDDAGSSPPSGIEDYCRRFAGFGAQRALPEQIAALDALAAIGGQEAARSVARIIGRCWVQGPTLASAVAAAARLGSLLPADIVAALLRHADPAIRRDACRLARRGPEVTAILVDLLGDLNRDVCMEAACALGRMGRPEAAPLLRHALRQAPSVHVIEAVAPVADEECVVLLGRLARGAQEDLAAAARAALEAAEHPLAARLLERSRQG